MTTRDTSTTYKALTRAQSLEEDQEHQVLGQLAEQTN